jgi:hypothetical protein
MFTNAKHLTVTGVAVYIALVSVPTHAQAPVDLQGSPQEIVQVFCTMDAQGKQLTPEGRKEVAPLLAQQKSWAGNSEITIIKDYVVRGPATGVDAAQVTVVYNVWGKLDSSLRFTPLNGSLANRPTLVPEYVTLTRLNAHAELGPDGQSHDATAPAEWRISGTPPEPHIGLEVAIRYVRQTGFRSRDAQVRMNAQRTLAALMSIYRMQALPGPWHQ